MQQSAYFPDYSELRSGMNSTKTLLWNTFCRSKLSGDGKNLPKKMKRLVVLETPEDYKGFDDLKDFKVHLF